MAGLFMCCAQEIREPVGRTYSSGVVYVCSHTYVPHFRPGTTLAISGHDASLDPDKVCDPPPAKLAVAKEKPGRNSRREKQKGRVGGAPLGRGDGERHSKIPSDPRLNPR